MFYICGKGVLARCFGLCQPLPHVAGHSYLVCSPAKKTNHGAYCAKEHEKECACPMHRFAGAGMWHPVLRDKTTLGNGYLGSRIDEERSEMRYLV